MVLRKLFASNLSPRSTLSLEIIRVSVSILILIHGTYRLVTGGVAPFGAWLEAQGVPAGYVFALAVTLIELVCPLLMVLRRFVSICAIMHIFILTLGIVLVHAPYGWFVVGAGRNGAEYSVLLIISLASVAWAYAPTMSPDAPADKPH